MGASTSTPAPLLEIDTSQGKVFIPSSFTVQPKLLSRNPPPPTYPHRPRPRPHFQPHTNGPGQVHHGLARRGGGGGEGGGGGGVVSESEFTHTSDASTLADINMPSRSPRVGQMGMGMGRGAGGGMGGMDGGGGGMGRRGYIEHGLDESGRPRSAPEMMRGGAGGHPGMMGNGMMGNGMMPPPGMQHPLSGMPPAYTTHPSMPHLPIGGMNMNPYLPGYPGPSHGPGPGPAPSSTSSSSTAPPAQPPRRGSGRRYEHVPTGAYASTEKPRRQRPHVEQQTSARLNKGQSSDKKVGPSGREWIDGDPFLDACICTTGCDCRKNQRVLYRARHDRPRRGRGSDDDSEDDGDEYGSGKIRYILRDDLGRNCGDHSGCKKDKSKKSETSESGSEDSKKKERKKKRQEKRKEEKKEEKKRKESFQGLKDDLLEALDSRFYDMNKASRQQQPTSTIPPQPPQPFGGRGMGPSPFMMGGPHHMDPRIAQQMGAMGGDGYRMGLDMPGRMPPGMSDPTSKRGMQYQSMGMGMDMGGGGGMVNFEDDISEIGPLSMGMPSPYAIPAGMQNHKAGIRRNFMSQGGARAGGAQGQFGGSLDMDPMAAVHAAQAMAQGRGRGRRGIMRGHMGGGGQPYSEPDDFDFGAPDPSIRPSGIQRHRTAAYDRPGGPRDRRRNSNDSCSVPRWHKFGVSPQRRATSSQDRSRQPRVDTDDDEAY